MAAQKPRTIFLLRLLQLNIYNLMVERLRPAGLTPIQYMVLSILSRRDTWSTAELARRFHIAPQSMTEIVASLQKKKLIARSKSLAHGRILNIRLTAAGTRVLERGNLAVDRLERKVFAAFDAGEMTQFRDLLGTALLTFAPDAKPDTKKARGPGRASAAESAGPRSRLAT
ncbi:MAG TPA: MarR family transcriptional regulator [Stellaceae bacterium]|jgi:DNA-binding MarR family transcriptional regulator|nr:MarR family transcriptional regulator [Stellaceae bacterium]